MFHLKEGGSRTRELRFCLFADAFLGGETDFIDGRALRMIILRRVL